MQQQQQQMAAQQQQQAIDQQNQIEISAQNQFAQAAVQDKIQKTFGNDEKDAENKSHEANMMDKKIELEKAKSKKTTVKEARSLGLKYVGQNKYANNQGVVTHMNESGYLVELNKDNLVD